MPRYSRYPTRRYSRGRKRTKTNRQFKAKVQRIISQTDEAKFVDTFTDADATPVAGTSVILPLSLVAGGTSDTTRIGDQIKLISVEMKYFIQDETDGNTNDTLARIIIFRAKKNLNGVLPAVTDLLSTDSITSLRETSGGSDMSDFKVYLDKTFVIQRKYSQAQQAIVKGKFFKSLGGLKCTYKGEAASIVVAEEGQLFLLRMTQQPITFSPEWTVSTRVRFREL